MGVIRQHIEIVEGAGGPKAVITGHRIRVQDVVIWHERVRMTPDEIVYHYPTISIADVYAALAYYWDNKDEIDRRIADDEAYVQEQKRKHVSLLEEKLMRLRRG
jgi:uncharacterized protein (DUF433 family)